MRTIKNSLVLGIFCLSVFLPAASALAYSPQLSVSGYGANVTISVSGAAPSSAIQMSYTQSGSNLPTVINNFGTTDYSGNFSTTASGDAYGISSGAQLYVTIGGQQSNVVTYGSNTNNGCGYYGCSVGGLTLSQTSVSMTVGQTSYVTASMPIYNPSFYISSNSTPGVVSAYMSGNQVALNGLMNGSSTVMVCAGSSSACGSIYVTVGNGSCYSGNCGSGNVWFSPSNPSLYVGQSLAVSINSSASTANYYTGGNVYYVSSNSNPNVVSASIVGTVLNLYANQSGSSSISVCLNSLNFCGTVYATVTGGSGNGSNQVVIRDNYFSPATINITPGTTVTWVNSGSMNHTVTADNNQFNSGNLAPGASFSWTFNTAGSYPYHCIYHGSSGGSGMSGTVVVGGGGFSNGIYFSPSSLNLSIGQNQNINIYTGNGSLAYNTYISSNSNPNVVSAIISNSTLTVSALTVGSSTISVCQSAGGQCGSVYVTVSGGGSATLTFSNAYPTMSMGQTLAITIFGGLGYSSSGFYISNNTNSNVAAAVINGYTLNITAINNGNDTITVCQSGYSACGVVSVTVTGGSNGPISFSQNYVNIGIGQSNQVTVYSNGNPTGNYYISSNSNPNVASGYLSNSVLNITGQNIGSTNLLVCQNSSSSCGTVYVTVGSTASGSLWFNQTNPSLNVGQIVNLSINSNNYSGNYYISGNTNQNSVAASISGSTLNLTGLNFGNSTITVCQSNTSICGSVYATVDGGSGGQVILSQNSVNVASGQTTVVTIYGNISTYVAYNSNPNIASASISNNQLTVYGYSSGNASMNICPSGSSSQCATLSVTVGGGYGGSGLYFTVSSLPTMVLGQYYSYQLPVSGGTPPYNFGLISGSLPSGLSLSSGGLITGVPSSSAFVSFSVRVTDNSGRSASVNFNLGAAGGGVQYPGGGSSVLGASTYLSGELIAEGLTVYIVYKNTKTGFVSGSVFKALGFSFSYVTQVGNSGLTDSGYTVSSAKTAHPWGSWIKSGQTIYFVSDSGLIPVPDWGTFLSNGGSGMDTPTANSYDFQRPMLSVMAMNDSRLR